MKVNNNYDSYEFLKLAHVATMCFGLPYTRRKIKESSQNEENAATAAGKNFFLIKA